MDDREYLSWFPIQPRTYGVTASDGQTNGTKGSHRS